jgi:uncharacterized protein (TIGR02588 family)
MAPRKPPAKQSASKARTPLLEWISAAIGLALACGLIGYVAWEAVSSDDTPPAMAVTALSIHPTPGGYVMKIRVENHGGSPAAQVGVEGTLTTPGAEPEVAETTFDYVPDHSQRDGGLFFTVDPRAGEVKLRARGYVEP